jgi:SAM-dependent methyltransferase
VVKQTVKIFGRPLWNKVKSRIGAEIEPRFAAHRADIAEIQHGARREIEELRRRVEELQNSVQSLRNDLDERSAELYQQRIFLPPEPLLGRSDPFMRYSTCNVLDILHPRYLDILHEIDHHFAYHRKAWEWVFIIHHLQQSGALAEGHRGLGFGIGRERLPALFAKKGCTVLATDAPPEIGIASGWSTTGQHASALDDLRYPSIVSDDVFDRRVSHRFCDMNAIPDDLTDFDFAWSSCCFEHLGSLEAGIEFVINSVEKTLKPGGVAVHTTEFNLSSNKDTVESGPTVIYRRRDMEELIGRLHSRGHQAEPFLMSPYAHPLDFHVDIPPYSTTPHLKLRIGEYAATSAGICVRRGY